MADLWHLRVKEMLSFLRVDRSTFLRYEGSGTIGPFRRDASDYRYSDLYEVCEIYEALWCDKPDRFYVADWLQEQFDIEKETLDTTMLRLLSRGLVS